MTYNEGDILSPSQLIVPETTTVSGFSGAQIVSGGNLFVSGGKFWGNIDGNLTLFTSS